MIFKIQLSYIYILFWILFISSCNDTLKTNSYNLPKEYTHQVDTVFTFDKLSEEDFLRSIQRVALLSEGNIIIQEINATRLIEINPMGNVVEVIGRKGRGPGEFSGIWDVVITPDDTLHIFERNSLRHHVLFKRKKDSTWEPVRESTIKGANLNSKFVSSFPKEVYKRSKGYKAKMMNFITPYDTTTKLYNYMVNTDWNLNSTGNFEILLPTSELAISRKNKSASINSLDEFKRAFYLYNQKNNSVIYIRNDSNEILRIDSNKNVDTLGYLPYERFPLIRENLDEYLDLVSKNAPHHLELIEKKLLTHEPYYRSITLYNNNLWIQLSRKDDMKPNWIVTSLDGKILKSFLGPENLTNIIIGNNRIYGLIQDLSNSQSLVSFEVK